MHVERLIEILTSKELILRQPEQWDDPFENYILKKSRDERRFKTSADIYGQCWTLLQESDAMWRIYSPDKMGVKVRSSLHKLFSQFWHELEIRKNPSSACFIGKVEYVHSNVFIKMDARTKLLLFENGEFNEQYAALTLLWKRPEFRHEEEVRLLYVVKHRGSGLGKGMAALLPYSEFASLATFSFTVDPWTLFDEIVLDPRMNEHTCKAYEAYILGLGFPGRIFQSSLYKLE